MPIACHAMFVCAQRVAQDLARALLTISQSRGCRCRLAHLARSLQVESLGDRQPRLEHGQDAGRHPDATTPDLDDRVDHGASLSRARTLRITTACNLRNFSTPPRSNTPRHRFSIMAARHSRHDMTSGLSGSGCSRARSADMTAAGSFDSGTTRQVAPQSQHGAMPTGVVTCPPAPHCPPARRRPAPSACPPAPCSAPSRRLSPAARPGRSR